jgi:hypothetical protein
MDLAERMRRRVEAKAKVPQAATHLNSAALSKSELLQILLLPQISPFVVADRR